MAGQPRARHDSKITAELMSRSQTIAVGGIRSNRSLAIAAPNWTEMIPEITSQTGGNPVHQSHRATLPDLTRSHRCGGRLPCTGF